MDGAAGGEGAGVALRHLAGGQGLFHATEERAAEHHPKQEVRSTNDNAGKEIRQAQGDARSRIETAEYEAVQKVVELEKVLGAERKESALQRGLNANLLQSSYTADFTEQQVRMQI